MGEKFISGAKPAMAVLQPLWLNHFTDRALIDFGSLQLSFIDAANVRKTPPNSQEESQQYELSSVRIFSHVSVQKQTSGPELIEERTANQTLVWSIGRVSANESVPNYGSTSDGAAAPFGAVGAKLYDVAFQPVTIRSPSDVGYRSLGVSLAAIDDHRQRAIGIAATANAASQGSIDDLAEYLNTGYWAFSGYQGTAPRHWLPGATVSVNINGLSGSDKVLAEAALDAWEEICDITFNYTAGTAQITYENGNDGKANTPHTVSGANLTSAKVHIALNYNNPLITRAEVFLHETGHALGLGHQGPYNESATYGVENIFTNDTVQWSVMSYFRQNNLGGATNAPVFTPQMADITAVQGFYGLKNTRTGPDTYGFGSPAGSVYDFSRYSGPFALTIYDSSGIDILNCSGYSAPQTVNLTPGTWSSIGGHKNNIGIFTTTTIENATGGTGQDTIIGNGVGNTLNGNDGNDALNGGAGTVRDILNGEAGNDILNGGPGADIMRGGTENDTYAVDDVNDVVFENANQGTDLVNSVVSLTLSANVENLKLLGANLNGTGNNLNNTLTGSSGNNILLGGLGDDTLKGGLGLDTLDGGDGFDSADFSDKTTAVVLTLNGSVVATAFVGGVAEDTVRNIENVGGGSGDDRLTGDGLANRLAGGLGADILVGGGANDYLIGGSGIDRLDGGIGFDTAYYLSDGGLNGIRVTYSAPGSASVIDSFGNTDTLISIESIYGTNRNDIITGSSGSESFLPGRGNDTVSGGGGSDTISYLADDAATSGVTINLATGSVTGAYYGNDALTGFFRWVYGTQKNDTLIANSAGGQRLEPSLGVDIITGGVGFDILRYDDYRTTGSGLGVTYRVGTTAGTGTVVDAGGSTDSFSGIEYLSGSWNNDTFIGGAIIAYFQGIGGNNTYRGGVAGFDRVDYSFDDSFGATHGVNINLATGTGTNAFGGTDTFVNIHSSLGTIFTDTFVGSGADDQFFGLRGTDSITGGLGNDAADYSQDANYGGLQGVNVNLRLNQATDGFGSLDTLSSIEYATGTRFVDTIEGSTGANLLRGLAGADSLNGGLGVDWVDYDWDRFYGGNGGVTVSLATGSGRDGFGSTDSLIGFENVAGTIFVDIITGDGLANRLSGSDGNDTLNGAAGNDVLDGGIGQDTFVFNTALHPTANVDSVSDFRVVDDTIQLENAIFAKLTTTGALAATAFFTGAAAHDADDRIIYNNATGALIYDSNGNLAGGATQFATLALNLGLSSADFVVI
jgi:serralysin